MVGRCSFIAEMTLFSSKETINIQVLQFPLRCAGGDVRDVLVLLELQAHRISTSSVKAVHVCQGEQISIFACEHVTSITQLWIGISKNGKGYLNIWPLRTSGIVYTPFKPRN